MLDSIKKHIKKIEETHEQISKTQSEIRKKQLTKYLHRLEKELLMYYMYLKNSSESNNKL